MEQIQNCKLAIYPYNPEFAAVLKRTSILNGCNEVFAVTPVGLGLEGKDAGEVGGGKSIGVRIESDFDCCLEQIDSVIFIDSVGEKEDSFYKALYKSVLEKKDVFLLTEIDEKIEHELKKIAAMNSSKFINFSKAPREIDEKSFIDKSTNDKLQKIDTPVIMIAGLSEYTNKFDVNLMLYNEIQKHGYKVSSIGSRNYCEFFGFHSFPQFMLSDNISGERKVTLFNKFLKTVELVEKPDVILVTVPGGVIPINNKISSGYGMLAYEISQAVKPDITVLCVPYEEHKPVFFPRIFEMLRYRFEFEADFINISNIRILWSDTRYREKISCLRINSSKVDKVVNELNKQMDQPFSNSLNNDSSVYITDCIINKLSHNLCII